MKRVRIKDIAALAGVSTGTVDRVLHNRGYVSDKKRQQVEAAMAELGYERNILASALAYNREINVLALVPFAEGDLYWERINQGIINAAKSVAHFGLSVSFQHFELLSPRHFAECANRIMESPPQALLFPPIFTQESRELIALAEAREVPYIMINTRLHDARPLCYVGQNSYQAGQLAARLLFLSMAADADIVILNLDKNAANAQHLIDKERGFRDFFAERNTKNIQVHSYAFEEFGDSQQLNAFLKEIRNSVSKPGGIFVTNSRAHLILDVLPKGWEEAMIIGFDLIAPNIEALRQDRITFLLNQNPEAQGHLGIMNFFDHFILDKEVPPQHYLPLDIVMKENEQHYPNKQLATFVG